MGCARPRQEYINRGREMSLRAWAQRGRLRVAACCTQVGPTRVHGFCTPG